MNGRRLSSSSRKRILAPSGLKVGKVATTRYFEPSFLTGGPNLRVVLLGVGKPMSPEQIDKTLYGSSSFCRRLSASARKDSSSAKLCSGCVHLTSSTLSNWWRRLRPRRPSPNSLPHDESMVCTHNVSQVTSRNPKSHPCRSWSPELRLLV